MNVLVVNSGSSSIKFEVISMPEEKVFVRGIVGDIGDEGSFFKITHPELHREPGSFSNHEDAFSAIFSYLTSGNFSVDAVGHRIVYGGALFKESVLLDDEKIELLKGFFPFAPLHMPYNVEGITSCKKIFGNEIPQVGVFDTSFHFTIPPRAFLYAIPYEFYEDCGIRRFGFHGTSFRYIMERLKEMGRDKGRVIICHLGNGASVVAVLDGKSMDTSMGFTPMEGLVMGTRCGDIDPGILIYLMREKGYSWERIDDILDRESGLKGLSGKTFEMKEIEELASKGDERAKLALDVYTYRVAKYIAAYTVPLGGLDVLVFTGGIGENSRIVRESVCGYLKHVGVTIDRDKNRKVTEGIVSGNGSKVDVMVIPTNEELMIARDCFNILSGP